MTFVWLLLQVVFVVTLFLLPAVLAELGDGIIVILATIFVALSTIAIRYNWMPEQILQDEHHSKRRRLLLLTFAFLLQIPFLFYYVMIGVSFYYGMIGAGIPRHSHPLYEFMQGQGFFGCLQLPLLVYLITAMTSLVFQAARAKHMRAQWFWTSLFSSLVLTPPLVFGYSFMVHILTRKPQ